MYVKYKITLVWVSMADTNEFLLVESIVLSAR